MKVSIIIPTYRRAKLIKECLISIFNQKINKNYYEVIVVSDGFDEKTDIIIKSFNKFYNLKYIKQKKSGPATARNNGIKKAKGHILVFLDDDCIIDGSWIKNIINAHKKYKEAGAIAGSITPIKLNLISEFSNGLEARSSLKDGEVFMPSLINNSSYKDWAIKKVKGFDESFRRASGEDVEFNYKLYKENIKTIFIKNIKIRHYYKTTLKSFLKQQFGFGFERVKLIKKTNDYPFDKSKFLLYMLKRIATPFLEPFLRFNYALKNKKRNVLLYIPLGYLQQFAYWSGFFYALIKEYT
jgi:glycosyltransferase involved in cell wall biosynthesis